MYLTSVDNVPSAQSPYGTIKVTTLIGVIGRQETKPQIHKILLPVPV